MPPSAPPLLAQVTAPVYPVPAVVVLTGVAPVTGAVTPAMAGAEIVVVVMASELEVTGVKEVGVKVRVKFPAVAVMTRLVKVAIPATAATVVVPERVPVPEAIDATTLTVEEVTVLPLASTMRITGWVSSCDPLAAPVG